jgi:hypothetical protein
MVWTCLVESEESLSPYKNGLAQSPTVRLIDTLEQSYFQECQKVNSQLPLFGMMCERLKKQTFQRRLTSSQEDFHVRTSASQDVEQAWKESEADYFSRSCGSPMSLDRTSFSWRTCQQLLLGGDYESPRSLPREGMIVDGALYPLLTLEHGTRDADGGYLPTLCARDYKDSGLAPSSARRKTTTLAVILGGALSPMWCEWFMGYPFGHTELKDWVIPWFQNKHERLL